jgi:hypothetical protein
MSIYIKIIKKIPPKERKKENSIGARSEIYKRLNQMMRALFPPLLI